MSGTKQSRPRVETEGYDALLDAEKLHDAAERLRLLYVAMTRARDHLVVSLHRKEKAQCHARAIAEVLDGAAYEVLAPGVPEDAADDPKPVDSRSDASLEARGALAGRPRARCWPPRPCPARSRRPR